MINVVLITKDPKLLSALSSTLGREFAIVAVPSYDRVQAAAHQTISAVWLIDTDPEYDLRCRMANLTGIGGIQRRAGHLHDPGRKPSPGSAARWTKRAVLPAQTALGSGTETVAPAALTSAVRPAACRQERGLDRLDWAAALDARRLLPGPARSKSRRLGPHHGRKRNRQGTGGASHPQYRQSLPAAVCGSLLRRHPGGSD